ncbi:hypothetical protein NL108_017611 [Boleophthalmus pectinirostris]|nr:hypothetical protein NL108_017611 [Boleophthalmus pectinirostris]
MHLLNHPFMNLNVPVFVEIMEFNSEQTSSVQGVNKDFSMLAASQFSVLISFSLINFSLQSSIFQLSIKCVKLSSVPKKTMEGKSKHEGRFRIDRLAPPCSISFLSSD